ncbi:PIG-L family deacetylase [Luteibacter sp. PPL552]
MLIERPLTLFVFAHPDDEFFCIPFIRDAVKELHEVRFVYLTDGAWGGQSASRRIQESLRVLSRYGVNASQVHFLGHEMNIPDGKLHLHLSAAYEAIRSLCGERLTNVFSPAWEGGHQDHDATHALALAVALDCPAAKAYQFPLYNAAGCIRPWFRVMAPLPSNGASFGRRVTLGEAVDIAVNAFRYPSQWKTWMALLPFAAWRLFTLRQVQCQPMSIHRLGQRPHEDSLLYERRGNATFAEVQSRVDALMEGRY